MMRELSIPGRYGLGESVAMVTDGRYKRAVYWPRVSRGGDRGGHWARWRTAIRFR